jgi:hypothetical protein
LEIRITQSIPIRINAPYQNGIFTWSGKASPRIIIASQGIHASHRAPGLSAGFTGHGVFASPIVFRRLGVIIARRGIRASRHAVILARKVCRVIKIACVRVIAIVLTSATPVVVIVSVGLHFLRVGDDDIDDRVDCAVFQTGVYLKVGITEAITILIDTTYYLLVFTRLIRRSQIIAGRKVLALIKTRCRVVNRVTTEYRQTGVSPPVSVGVLTAPDFFVITGAVISGGTGIVIARLRIGAALTNTVSAAHTACIQIKTGHVGRSIVITGIRVIAQVLTRTGEGWNGISGTDENREVGVAQAVLVHIHTTYLVFENATSVTRFRGVGIIVAGSRRHALTTVIFARLCATFGVTSIGIIA